MKLYLIQHGEAKTEKEDPERSLTEIGEEEIKRVSKAAEKLNIRPLRVYHSGKKRARQTAGLIAAGLKISPPSVQAFQDLNPNDDVKPWAERICQQTEDLMIVGHLPFLDKLASLLISGNEILGSYCSAMALLSAWIRKRIEDGQCVGFLRQRWPKRDHPANLRFSLLFSRKRYISNQN
jgi:phosphohistidine phosphatase